MSNIVASSFFFSLCSDSGQIPAAAAAASVAGLMGSAPGVGAARPALDASQVRALQNV